MLPSSTDTAWDGTNPPARGPVRTDPNDGYESLMVTLTAAQVDALAEIADESHDGTVQVQRLVDNAGLEWVEVTYLTRSQRPLTTVHLTPTGNREKEGVGVR